jgi:three-Cys-motif partner protein
MPDISLEPDGLPTPEVGAWSELKYKLIGLYSNLFSTGMKHKWDQRVFIDLYAGAGISQIRGTNKLVMGSPLIGLTVRDRFDHYIFCDENPENIAALKKRVQVIAPGVKADFMVGDSNSSAIQIANLISRPSATNKVLSLCIVDPFDIGFRFSTIQVLAQKLFVDFLVLLAVYMDANRNYAEYLKPTSAKVENFLGVKNWRDKWKVQEQLRVDFPDFLAKEFNEQMTTLGYITQPLHKMKKVRSDERNLPLYRLALFSRNPQAYRFWDAVLEYSTMQRTLFKEEDDV